MPKALRKSTRSSSRTAEPSKRTTRNAGTRTRPKSEPLKTIEPSSNRRQRKKHSLPFLLRSQEEEQRDPNRRLPLFALPRELVQDIASILPIESAVCFTLTCKEAVSIVGTWPWKDFKSEERWAFSRTRLFEFLLRDWSDGWEFCDRCNTVHPPMPPARSHRKTKLTTHCLGQDAMIDYLPRDDSSGYGPIFFHISEAIKLSEDHAAKRASGPLIDVLSGDFTVTKPNLSWRLLFSGRRIDGNLVIEHVHTFQSTTKKALCAMDLLSLPIRLCPHQSTITGRPEPSKYIRSVEKNGPQLTHAIANAIPIAQRTGVNMDLFKKPTPLEKEQMSAANAGEDVLWRCRSCPTKYRVGVLASGVVIVSWHCFGRDFYHASKYWKWFVRRKKTTLGLDKRNDK